MTLAKILIVVSLIALGASCYVRGYFDAEGEGYSVKAIIMNIITVMITMFAVGLVIGL